MSFYEDLMNNVLKKEASTQNDTGVSSMDTDELCKLATELAELTNDNELAEMAKILPVYAMGSRVDKETDIANAIQETVPDVAPTPIEVEAAKDDISVIAAAECDDKEAEKDGGEKKENPFAKKEDEEKDEEDSKDEEKKDSEEEDKSASEQLLGILKEGAEFEDMIENLATERAFELLKLAEEMEQARAIVDAAASKLSDSPTKAYDYSEQLMEQAKTVAAAKTIPVPEAAAAVAAEVIAKAAPIEAQAQYYLEELAKQATEYENAYEKIAEQAGEIAAAVIRNEGAKQGLPEAKLHEFVQRGMEEVKTVAAKTDTNLAEAAQMYIAGNRGSEQAVVEAIVPSPSMVPPVAKQPINSNQTQSPDDYFAEMTKDPQVVKAAFEIVNAVMAKEAGFKSPTEKTASDSRQTGVSLEDTKEVLNQMGTGVSTGAHNFKAWVDDNGIPKLPGQIERKVEETVQSVKDKVQDVKDYGKDITTYSKGEQVQDWANANPEAAAGAVAGTAGVGAGLAGAVALLAHKKKISKAAAEVEFMSILKQAGVLSDLEKLDDLGKHDGVIDTASDLGSEYLMGAQGGAQLTGEALKDIDGAALVAGLSTPAMATGAAGALGTAALVKKLKKKAAELELAELLKEANINF